MAQGDAYAASGGWSGGSPLASTGGVLSNYMQKIKTVNPATNSLTVAQPAQQSAQSSSLVRALTTAPTQTTAAQPVQSPQPDPVTTAAQSAAYGATVAAQHAAQSNPQPTAQQVAAQNNISASLAATRASLDAANAAPAYNGAKSAFFNYNGSTYQLYYNPATNSYQGASYDTLIATDPANAATYRAKQAAINAAAQAYNAQQQPALSAYAQQLAAHKQAQQAEADKQQQAQDAVLAQAAQNAADKAAAFRLASSLQAPNTQAVDQAGQNDLARVVSQYSGGLGGVDAAAYNYAGQGAQATQAAVNRVNHDQAYANAFNQNYSTFTNALAAQQTADVNASSQKLSYDIQGINDAVSQMEQASGQLSQSTKTQFDATLIPLKQALNDYKLAVATYKVDSRQAIQAAQVVLGLASSLATAGIKA